eukprot:TRINITY_DN109117_c0_g1_i1.p1 TRINITY_DN109117_c0_g1~~TRINITY_DN109117_c0_g1_i1.p1  ORF type:complete len:236 (+),score=30.24 TRINITY_DN109117_c0_g1_i1:91-798(+)
MLGATLKSLFAMAMFYSAQSLRETGVQMHGADTAAESEGHTEGPRCCCKAAGRNLPEDICLNPSTMQAFRRTRGKGSPEFTRTFAKARSGQGCNRYVECKDKVETYSVRPIGEASNYSSSIVAIGNELFEFAPAEQTETKCAEEVCSRNQPNCCMVNGDMRCGPLACLSYCHDKKTCQQYKSFDFCGHGLKRYTKIGLAGECVPEDQLRKKWWVGYKTCPSGTHHKGCHCKGECD